MPVGRVTLIELIEYAIRAPSGHNAQPWRFTLRDHTVTIQPDYKRRLPVADPDDRGLFISLGCALENLIVAAQAYGYTASVTESPQQGDDGRIRIDLIPAADSEPDPDNRRLADAIRQRQTTRRPFEARNIPPLSLLRLERSATQALVTTRLLTTDGEKELLREPIREAARSQFTDPAWRAELTQWIRFNRSEIRRHRDGLAANVMGFPAMPRWLGRLVLSFATSRPALSDKLAAEAVSSPALMAFVVNPDTRATWVAAGRSFQRTALQATIEGLRCGYVNMPCEVPAVSDELSKTLNCEGRPVLLVRLGYAAAMPYSERRRIACVLNAPSCCNDATAWDEQEAAE